MIIRKYSLIKYLQKSLFKNNNSNTKKHILLIKNDVKNRVLASIDAKL